MTYTIGTNRAYVARMLIAINEFMEDISLVDGMFEAVSHILSETAPFEAVPEDLISYLVEQGNLDLVKARLSIIRRRIDFVEKAINEHMATHPEDYEDA